MFANALRWNATFLSNKEGGWTPHDFVVLFTHRLPLHHQQFAISFAASAAGLALSLDGARDTP